MTNDPTESQPTLSANKSYHNLSIIIPAYNEEDGIVATLATLREYFPASEIIVVDDGSRDKTAQKVAEFSDVKLLRHRFNRGYGGALKSGMRQAERELIAWFDADNEHRPEFLQAMVDQIENEKLAAVLGQRPKSVSVVRGVGKYFIRLLARLLKVKSGTDLNCGLRVFRREVILPYIYVLPDSYSASLTSTIVLLEQRYPFAFHPIEINPRIGQSKVALADGFNTLFLVLRIITLFAPMRIFLRVSVSFFLIGLFYSIYIAITRGEGVPVLGAVLLLASLLVAVLGLIADQISQLRIIGMTNIPVIDENIQDQD